MHPWIEIRRSATLAPIKTEYSNKQKDYEMKYMQSESVWTFFTPKWVPTISIGLTRFRWFLSNHQAMILYTWVQIGHLIQNVEGIGAPDQALVIDATPHLVLKVLKMQRCLLAVTKTDEDNIYHHHYGIAGHRPKGVPHPVLNLVCYPPSCPQWTRGPRTRPARSSMVLAEDHFPLFEKSKNAQMSCL